MPPKAAFARPAFKPPRPINAVPVNISSSSNDTAAAPPSRPATTASAKAPSTIKAPTRPPILPFHDSDDESDAFDDIDAHILPPTDPTASTINRNNNPSPTPPTSSTIPSTIPAALLTRLLHDNFQDADTRITKEAMALFVKYVDTFAAEAVARALAERGEMVEKMEKEGKSNEIGDDFLQVVDLERLAPGLLMDF